MKKALLISFLIFEASCNTDCLNQTDKFKVRKAPINHLKELEQIKDVLIRNITLLEDSCCQNLASSCGDPDSVRKKYFYPATKYLLNKYLPEEEKEKLTVLDKLSPIHLQNSSLNVINSDLFFRSDSTIIFPVYYLFCDDVVTEHRIIYSTKNTNFYVDKEVKLIERREISPNWSYYITTYKYEGW